MAVQHLPGLELCLATCLLRMPKFALWASRWANSQPKTTENKQKTTQDKPREGGEGNLPTSIDLGPF